VNPQWVQQIGRMYYFQKGENEKEMEGMGVGMITGGFRKKGPKDKYFGTSNKMWENFVEEAGSEGIVKRTVPAQSCKKKSFNQKKGLVTWGEFN